MDLGGTQKTPSKLGGFSTKQVAFFAIAGLVLVGGIALRASHYLGEPAGEEKVPAVVDSSAPKSAPEAATPPEAAPVAAPEAATPPAAETAAEPVLETPPAAQEAATPPTQPAEQAGDAAEPAKAEGDTAEQPLPDASVILVARRPVELLASPSPSATVMFGFPAGRPFRVIGQEGGFAHIRDLKSGTTGWIDKTALAPPPPRAPAPSQAKPAGGGRKSFTASSDAKATKKETSVADDATPATQPSQRPGLFGQGGLFGGIFSSGN